MIFKSINEICDIDDSGIISSVRTVDILDLFKNEISFIDSKHILPNFLNLENMLIIIIQSSDYYSSITIQTLQKWSTESVN